MQQDIKNYPKVNQGSFQSKLHVKWIEQDEQLHSFKILPNGLTVQLTHITQNNQIQSEINICKVDYEPKKIKFDAQLSQLFVKDFSTVGYINQKEKKIKYLNTETGKETYGDSDLCIPSLEFIGAMGNDKIPAGFYDNGVLIQCFQKTHDLVIVQQNGNKCLLQHYSQSHQLKFVKEFERKEDLLMYKVGEQNQVLVFSQEIVDYKSLIYYYDGSELREHEISFTFKQGIIVSAAQWINNTILIFVNPNGQQRGQILIYNRENYDQVELDEEFKQYPVIEDCLWVNTQRQEILLKLGPDSYTSETDQVQECVALVKLDQKLEVLKKNVYPLWTLYDYIYDETSGSSLEVRYRILDIDDYKIEFEDLEQTQEHRGGFMNEDEKEYEEDHPQQQFVLMNRSISVYSQVYHVIKKMELEQRFSQDIIQLVIKKLK